MNFVKNKTQGKKILHGIPQMFSMRQWERLSLSLSLARQGLLGRASDWEMLLLRNSRPAALFTGTQLDGSQVQKYVLSSSYRHRGKQFQP